MYDIFTDTSANLPTALLKQEEIGVLPFSYFINETEEHQCLDTETFDGHSYYQSMREGSLVSTAQIPPQQYADCWEGPLLAGRDVLFVSMSSGISGSYSSAMIAAREMQETYPECKVEVIDTLGASLGEGLIALEAAKLRRLGKSLTDTATLLREKAKAMCQIFTVDNLQHLQRMGRLSNMTARIGSVLNIKPILKGNEEGRIVSFNMMRGRRRAIEALARIYNRFVVCPEVQTVGIAHADCAEDADYLAGLLQLDKPPREILTVCYEPVTGAHVGPDTLALFFQGGENVRSVNLLTDLMEQLPRLRR